VGTSFIPDLTDTADIQSALKLLYYGTTQAATTNGIYGSLASLQTQISATNAGINVHENAKYATTTTITGTYSAGSADNSATPGTGINAYITFTATGAQSIDGGSSLALGDRVLVKNGTSIGASGTTTSIANGIYVVQSNGTGGQSTLTPTFSNGSATKVVLVRSTDANNSIAGDFAEGDFLYVSEGSTNANESFMLTTTSATGGAPTGTIRIGTDTVTYNQFIGVGSYYVGSTAAAISPGAMSLSSITGISGSTVDIASDSSSGTSGNISFISGAAQNSTGTTTISTGAASNVSSGSLTLSTGTVGATSTSASGSITIATGVPANTTGAAISGNITINTANTNSSGAGTGGTVTITAGNGSGSSGVGGSITLNAGTGVSTGTISLAATSGNVSIGRSGSTTTLSGQVNNSLHSPILKTASFTVGAGEYNFNVTGTATVTVTLPTATAGRTINIVNKAAFAINSASSNVYPRTSNTLGTAICAASAGSWATLVANGTNWYIMAGG
jgi:hypothetical protein